MATVRPASVPGDSSKLLGGFISHVLFPLPSTAARSIFRNTSEEYFFLAGLAAATDLPLGVFNITSMERHGLNASAPRRALQQAQTTGTRVTFLVGRVSAENFEVILGTALGRGTLLSALQDAGLRNLTAVIPEMIAPAAGASRQGASPPRPPPPPPLPPRPPPPAPFDAEPEEPSAPPLRVFRLGKGCRLKRAGHPLRQRVSAGLHPALTRVCPSPCPSLLQPLRSWAAQSAAAAPS